jgi:hypothetical protein
MVQVVQVAFMPTPETATTVALGPLVGEKLTSEVMVNAWLVTAVVSAEVDTVIVLAALAASAFWIPAACVKVMRILARASMLLSPALPAAVPGSMSGTVKVTALPETVTAAGFTNSSSTPVPVGSVTLLAFIVMAEVAIVAGTVSLLNVTVIDPPTFSCWVPVTEMVYSAISLALVGETVTAAELTSLTGKAAVAGLAENMPKANIVAMTPKAKSSASPKDFPIVVFIYSYSPCSTCLKRSVLC